MLFLQFIDKDENPIGKIFVKRIPNVNELIRFKNKPDITYKVLNILHLYEENMNYDLDIIYVIVDIYKQFLDF